MQRGVQAFVLERFPFAFVSIPAVAGCALYEREDRPTRNASNNRPDSGQMSARRANRPGPLGVRVCDASDCRRMLFLPRSIRLQRNPKAADFGIVRVSPGSISRSNIVCRINRALHNMLLK